SPCPKAAEALTSQSLRRLSFCGAYLLRPCRIALQPTARSGVRAMKPTSRLAAAAALLCLALALASPCPAGSPNIPSPTFPRAPLWNAPEPLGDDGWSLQRHAVTGHWRLLDSANIRRAWGTREACLDAYEAESNGGGAARDQAD